MRATCVLLLRGRSAAAYRTATTMAEFVIPLEDKSPAAAAAAADLLRCGHAGQGLDLVLLDRVAAELEQERARPGERTRPGRRTP